MGIKLEICLMFYLPVNDVNDVNYGKIFFLYFGLLVNLPGDNGELCSRRLAKTMMSS